MTTLYSPADRTEVIDRLVALLQTDPRVDGAILVGSLVAGGDAWSDVDLQMAVSPSADVADVAADWHDRAYADLPVLHHLAFPLGDTEHMLCLLLENMLEVDLVFTATTHLNVYEPFRLLYERQPAVAAALRNPPPWTSEPPAWTAAAGTLWHDVLHACTAVRRDRRWQALHYMERIRTATLRLASQQRGFYAGELNYVDDLPGDLLAILQPTLVASLEAAPMFAAIEAATRGFLVELCLVDPDLAHRLERPLLEFIAGMDPATSSAVRD